MNRIKNILVSLFFLHLTACDNSLSPSRPLPFPTPAQHDLVVLVAPGPLTWQMEDETTSTGLEHDLIEAFAGELGVSVKYIQSPPSEIDVRMRAGEAHIAIGWLGKPENPEEQTTPPILKSHDVLIQHEASLPLTKPEELSGRTVHALAGSRQLSTLHKLQQSIPDMKVVASNEADIFELLESVSSQKNDLAAIDSALAELAAPLIPAVQATLALSEEQPIVWWLGKKPNVELLARINRFAEKAQHDGTLASIEDRYLGHVHRLKQADILNFMSEIETTLPKLKKYFQAAELVTDIDWRLIAAVAFHESHWDANATSYTNVRGIMMLTEETADRLRVNNRLDPKEAILAGARYINLLKDQIGDETPEPDRTWLALAAYNIGPGNFSSGQRLAKILKSDPNNWFEMKQVLPKLALPKFRQQLKTGPIRGGEAVILVENIRSYYNILLYNTPTFDPSPAVKTSLQRLVAEVDQLRKNYVSKPKMPTMLSMAGDTEETPRLPMIETDPAVRGTEKVAGTGNR